MTTQTSLSKATRAQRDESIRNSSFQPPAPSFQKLIANLELEFHLTHRKISLLKISNRKFFAILRLTSQLHHPSLTPSSGRGFIPSANARGIISLPLAPHHPRKPFVLCLSPNTDRPASHQLPLALTHPRKTSVSWQPPKTTVTSACPLPLALPHPRRPSVRRVRQTASGGFLPFLEGSGFIPSVNDRGPSPLPLVYPESRRAPNHPRKPFFTNHQSRATNHGFLIYGRAIRIPRNPIKNNSLKISNRR